MEKALRPLRDADYERYKRVKAKVAARILEQAEKVREAAKIN